jgi:hypothetical protein
MNIKYYIIFCLLYLTNCYQIINIDKPECKKCIYFTPKDLLFNRIEFAECKYYGRKNIINGKISYEYASIARKYNDCGVNGTRFVYDPNYNLKLRSKLLYDIIHYK